MLTQRIREIVKSARSRTICGPCDLSRPGLEIGPSFQPLVPKSLGFPVEVVDYLDQEGLRAKYGGGEGIDIGRIEPVDHVWDGRPLDQVVRKGGANQTGYHWIIASHVAEHVPDFLGLLRACSALLEPGGILALALPDRRFTLDVGRPPSGLATVLDAHLRGDVRPSPGVLAELRSRALLRGRSLSWRPWNVLPLGRAWTDAEVRDTYARATVSVEYEDAHVWCFDPKGMRIVLRELAVLGLLDMEVVRIRSRWGLEFFVWLRKPESA